MSFNRRKHFGEQARAREQQAGEPGGPSLRALRIVNQARLRREEGPPSPPKEEGGPGSRRSGSTAGEGSTRPASVPTPTKENHE